MSEAKPRVLLIAEAANPDWVSVPLVGWSHARALLDVVDAHLVTQVRNRESIERAGLREGMEFSVIDSEPVARPLWQATSFIRKVTGLGWQFETAMQALPYYYFERLLWKRFESGIASGQYDVVHRLTPLSPSIPSLIADRCARHGVPFVWGPINGGVPWPPGFAAVQRREGEWLHAVRDAYRFLPGYASTRKKASAILVGSIAARDQLPAEVLERTVYLPENAIEEERFPEVRTGPVTLPLRVAFVGRLVALKGVDMLIEAAASLIRAGKLVIDIIGDGPEKESLQALCDRLRCATGVNFEGWVEHEKIAAHLLRADVLGFPSVREFGGGVVLEAMALGVVPIVANYAGPAELVTDDTGYRVALGSREDLVANLRQVLNQLVADPSPLMEMGKRARDRVHRLFTWKVKAQQTNEIYRWVLGRRNKPDFGIPLE